MLYGQEIESSAGIGEACSQAEHALGCAPAGRLRNLVFLAVAAAMLQRVRGDDGVPLFLVKGGLVWQPVLGSHARPTYDLDGSIACGYDEFMRRARVALAKPWGCMSATIENAHAFSASTVPYDLFFFDLIISSEDGQTERIPCEGSYGEPSYLLEPHAYPALALDVVGLPLPDALWGVTPTRGVCDKLLNLTEPLVPADDPTYAGHERPHRKAKHLVDAVLLSRIVDGGELSTIEQMRAFIEARVAYDNRMRLERGFVPFARPLRLLPYDDWGFEYLVACIESGLDLPYEEALAEIGAFIERLDP